MKYFLDTNVIIDMLKGKHSCMLRHFENIYSTDIYVPAIVVAELEYGAAHSVNYEKAVCPMEKSDKTLMRQDYLSAAMTC